MQEQGDRAHPVAHACSLTPKISFLLSCLKMLVGCCPLKFHHTPLTQPSARVAVRQCTPSSLPHASQTPTACRVLTSKCLLTGASFMAKMGLPGTSPCTWRNTCRTSSSLCTCRGLEGQKRQATVNQAQHYAEAPALVPLDKGKLSHTRLQQCVADRPVTRCMLSTCAG